MKESKVIRILPKRGTQNINIDLEQDFDYLEILSMKILQKDAYRIFCSDKGVLVGKVTANGGFPIKNAKISIFIPLDEKDAQNSVIRELYPFSTPNDTLANGKRYNLLPRDKQLATPADHVPVGTFPSKYDIMTNPNLKYIHEKYYKYTTVSNENGDYMFFGLPSGTHIVHMDVDLSDIGTNSITPADLINLGYSPFLFNNESKFKNSNDLNQLAQIVGINNTTFVEPFWGDPDQCQFGITRLDFFVARFVNPKSYLIGSFYTDADESKTNHFVPSSCWQKEAIDNDVPEGFKAGVSRIVKATDLRTPRQVKAAGEAQGHKGIIEAVRISRDGFPEYVGKWETDINGNFVIPLPLNLGLKVWDEDLQGWRDDEENGVPTYADYRFKFYFENQGDYDLQYGLIGPQLETTLNRGVLFAPNFIDGSQNKDANGDVVSEENNYTFYAQPVYGSPYEYEYNMFDQFGNRIKEFSNYKRLRTSSFYTVSQVFNYKSDFDSAVQDIGRGGLPDFDHTGAADWYFPNTQGGQGGTSWWYSGVYSGEPNWESNSIGTNPWIISRSYVNTDLYSDSDVTSRNLFPTNYLFYNYYMKNPLKQDYINGLYLLQYGGFVSKYSNNPMIAASYRGLGQDSYFGGGTDNAELVNGAGDALYGNASNINGCDSTFGTGNGFYQRIGELITDMVDSTTPAFSTDGSMDGCIGCLTFGSYIDGGIYSQYQTNNGSWYNEQAEPYVDQGSFSKINANNTVGNSPGDTITGNIMMGGFVAPYAAKYRLKTTLVTTCTNAVNSWIVVGLSYCDSTTTNCNNNANWNFSGHTAFYGDTNTDGVCEYTGLVGNTIVGNAPVDFSSNVHKAVNGNNSRFVGNEFGELEWKNIYLKEGMGVRVTVRPTNSDDNSTPVAGGRTSSQVGVCYNCTCQCNGQTNFGGSQSEVSSFEVVSSEKISTLPGTDRNIDEPLHGSLYFPQFYVGTNDNQCCSRCNSEPDQSWDDWRAISLRQRTSNWQNNSLLYAGSYGDPLSLDYRYYNDEGNDPLGGQVIGNCRYYSLKTIGETRITEITKDIPNFQQGVNQWATLDRYLPSSSAQKNPLFNGPFTSRENDYEDFDTLGNGNGATYLQHKYFAPYDNLLFRVGQQWPRDEEEDGTEILCPENTIPGYYDWSLSTWNGQLVYPVSATYNPLGNDSFSNWHVFRNDTVTFNPEWKPWIRRVPYEWNLNPANNFWWSNIQPVPNTGYNGLFNNPWGDGNSFDNDRGADNAYVKAYPTRGYYLFNLYLNLSPAEQIKRILGYKTGLMDQI